MSSFRLTSLSAHDRICSSSSSRERERGRRREGKTQNSCVLNSNILTPPNVQRHLVFSFRHQLHTAPLGCHFYSIDGGGVIRRPCEIYTSPSPSRRPPPTCSWPQCPHFHCKRWNSYLLPWEPFFPGTGERENKIKWKTNRNEIKRLFDRWVSPHEVKAQLYAESVKLSLRYASTKQQAVRKTRLIYI